jgi:hypothetical protein
LLVVTCAELVVLDVNKDSPNSEADVLLLIPAEQVRYVSEFKHSGLLPQVLAVGACGLQDGQAVQGPISEQLQAADMHARQSPFEARTSCAPTVPQHTQYAPLCNV